MRADYDEGYFDKDEQGWCTRRVQLSRDGDRVTIRRSGDDNGLRPYDETIEATVGPAWPELGLTQLLGPHGPLAYFDANTGRLRHHGEQVPHWFKPPANFRGPDCLLIALEVITPIAEQLGMRPGPPPRAIDMPPPTPSTTAAGALERHRSVPGEDGCAWTFMLRDYPPGDRLGPQLDVRVHDERRWVSLFAGETDRAMLLFFGPLERYHLAIAARDRAIAAWCAR